ncbi:MAG TPA: peptide-methionine (R)-S-oxide reductase MsrB [Candidatus Saccharimonadaceae bacterium]|nr:peptide-methionine (R)-S-oxide reductase MsrB [Candidatus Saccharimonadaceae bacterium]
MDKKWSEHLSEAQRAVLVDKQTEVPFSGEYETLYADGSYACAACGATLFESKTKFDAHCGWPSFYDAVPGSVVMTPDDSHGMARTEVTCARCGGHLGHIFEGEGFATPTDQRYCVNSISLKFIPPNKTTPS